jgi:hypothetical protein
VRLPVGDWGLKPLVASLPESTSSARAEGERCRERSQPRELSPDMACSSPIVTCPHHRVLLDDGEECPWCERERELDDDGVGPDAPGREELERRSGCCPDRVVNDVARLTRRSAQNSGRNPI